MAEKKNITTKLVLQVENGEDKNGKPVYSQRTFQHISPELGTDDIYALGTALGALQSRGVVKVSRVENAELANA